MRRAHTKKLFDRFVDAGIVKPEITNPTTSDELDAMVCGVTALAAKFPESGLISQTLSGGEIRPVGKREIKILTALP